MADNNIEIELQSTQTETQTEVQLPMNFLALGQIENDDVKVYIKQSTYKALEKLASSDTTKELGSILIGAYTQDQGKTHVVISDHIEAKYTDASASTLTFTHETWDYVHKEHARKYPDKKIIGWQHTHPGYGIFLSNYDMFIQENFFNMPFQIAYVIDPVQNLRGFFQWKNGKVEKLKGYYIYDEVGKTIKIEPAKKKEEVNKAPAAQTRLPWLTMLIIAALCIVSIVLSVNIFDLRDQYVKLEESQNAILSRVDEQNAVIAGQANTISQLQTQLDASSGEQTEEDTQAQETEYARFVIYTVAQGDTLESICQANGVDYPTCKGMILGVNGIADADHIFVGQELLIPVYN